MTQVLSEQELAPAPFPEAPRAKCRDVFGHLFAYALELEARNDASAKRAAGFILEALGAVDGARKRGGKLYQPIAQMDPLYDGDVHELVADALATMPGARYSEAVYAGGGVELAMSVYDALIHTGEGNPYGVRFVYTSRVLPSDISTASGLPPEQYDFSVTGGAGNDFEQPGSDFVHLRAPAALASV